ncbi:protein FAR1-RELATED SEQUENCE 5-like [Bidens hawaiensis]|uniref:protein FAR1-RELATED SEQUENCE 5-like n=1 Tax=Bidens hawaiensis TaxID=980011 RepID=UPI00404AD504
MVFESVDHAYDFYCEYAKKAGFCVRKGGSYMNEGLLKSKYFTCSKEGHKPTNSYDYMAEKDRSSRPYYKRRKRPTVRCGCRAQIFLKSVDGLRKLTHVQQDIIYEMSTLNLGPVKAFNILRTKYGGFEEVGATKMIYDAEMVVQRLSGKKNCCDGYSFEYTVNTNGELDRLFWADDISKKNYLAFRDIISFDATFKTNKYNMVFVPFTAIDNHCRNVTVGAALLSSESIESYSWLLKVFLDSFGISPKVVVTDQDPAMKQAISLVLPNSRHRLCMWHIMKKLADKTDAISQSEFETQRKLIMKEYDLETNKWLSDMFEMRYYWIPAYYMDEPLSVEFFSHFDHCMEIQRHNGRKNDHDTRYTHPDPVSSNPFEKEAELMYTKAIFNDFQDEMYHIRRVVACLKSTEEEDCVRFYVFDFNAYVPGCLEVLFKKEGEDGIDSTISCQCKRFEHYGLLCRHSLYILNLFRVTRFPKKYMVDRWKRDAGLNPRTAPISSFGNDKFLKVKEI